MKCCWKSNEGKLGKHPRFGRKDFKMKGFPLPDIEAYYKATISESCSFVSNSLWPHGLYRQWDSPGQNAGVGSHSLLRGILTTQGSNPGLPHCRQILYQLSHQESLICPKHGQREPLQLILWRYPVIWAPGCLLSFCAFLVPGLAAVISLRSPGSFVKSFKLRLLNRDTS